MLSLRSLIRNHCPYACAAPRPSQAHPNRTADFPFDPPCKSIPDSTYNITSDYQLNIERRRSTCNILVYVFLAVICRMWNGCIIYYVVFLRVAGIKSLVVEATWSL